MYRFVARENIKHFQRQLEECSDERQKETLRQLLAAEEEKLDVLESRRSGHKQQALDVEESQAALRESIAETERLVGNSDEMSARHQSEREQGDSQGWAADG